MLRLALLFLMLPGAALADCGCTSDETCCADDNGYACCVNQASYCVAFSETNPFPSRCCPQWTIGCDVGSVGCCDPARPFQLNEANRVAFNTGELLNLAMPSSLVNVSAYALFHSGGVGANVLDCLTISVHDGKIQQRIALSGPAAAYLTGFYGESPRLFSFAPSRRRFYLFDTDRSGHASSVGLLHYPASAPEITLYGINPASGESTAQVVNGASGSVVSFAYHPESDTLVVAVATAPASDNDDTNGAVNFYQVNPSDARATLMGSSARGASEETSAAFYCGYVSALALDPATVLRFGYLQVTTGQGPGLGVTSLPLHGRAARPPSSLPSLANPPNATTIWGPAPEADGYGLPRSFSRFPGTDIFYGLAPSTGPATKLSVVVWSRDGIRSRGDAAHMGISGADDGGGAIGRGGVEGKTADNARVVLSLPNAHPPQFPIKGGTLGYVADCAVATDTGGVYVALVVAKAMGGQGYGLRDRWSVVGLDLATEQGGQVTLNGDPWFEPLGAETLSLVGVGIRVE